MKIEPKLSRTISGQYQIVDGKGGDGNGDGAPLVKFYNEFNDIKTIEKMLRGIAISGKNYGLIESFLKETNKAVGEYESTEEIIKDFLRYCNNITLDKS